MQIFGHQEGPIQLLAQRLQDCNVRLRWGGPQVAGALNGQVHLLDGYEQLQHFVEAGVPCPEFTPDLPLGRGWLGRKRQHTQGKDISRSQSSDKVWRQSDYWVKYMPAKSEWRFHILNGHSIGRGLKVWVGPGPEPQAPPVIRSRRLGWHLQHNVEPPKGLRKVAKAAVAACGYELAAVDILELADGTPCVLECNSRPAIRDPYTLLAYERAFRGLGC